MILFTQEKKVHKKKVTARLPPSKMEGVIKIKDSVEPKNQNAKRGKKRKPEEHQVAGFSEFIYKSNQSFV